jgi:type VI secretion system protein VasD
MWMSDHVVPLAMLRPLLALPLLVALSGCGWFSGPNTDPTPVTIDVIAAKDINSALGNVPQPVVVHLVLLTSKDAFMAADFVPLYTKEKVTLAADLVDSGEVEIRPGQTQTFKFDDAKNATILGALAAFEDIDNAKWRDSWVLKPHELNKVEVQIGIGSITIAKKKDTGGFWFLW